MSRDLAGHGPLQPALRVWKLARTAPPRREAQGNDRGRDDDHLFQDTMSPQTPALTGCISGTPGRSTAPQVREDARGDWGGEPDLSAPSDNAAPGKETDITGGQG